MSRTNPLKTRLKAGGRVFGSWSMLSSPSVVNVMGCTGLDFVIIDLEHGPTSFETVEHQLYAVESTGCTPIIRLGEASDFTILRALEVGAQALLVSHVSTADEARRIVHATKYPPEGNRGLSPFTRTHDYSEQDIGAKLHAANEQMLVGVLVEGAEGVRNLDEIAAVAGLDVVYVGVYDVSMSIGVPGDLTHPDVVKVLNETVRVVEGHGKAAGSVARDHDYLRLLVASGFRFLSYRCDSAILRDGLDMARQWFNTIDSELGLP